MKRYITFMIASQALSQVVRPGGTLGRSEPSLDDRSLEIYREAMRAPNATRSITLKPWEWARGNDPRLARQEWTWRVNVTDISLPHLASRFPSISNPHFVSTTYDFTWLGGGNISRTLGGSTSPFCITTVDTVFPPNITNLYNESNTHTSDCEAVLGSDCRSKLDTDGNNLRAGRCGSPRTIWSKIPECSATFGYALQPEFDTYSPFGLSTFNINGQPGNNTRNDTESFMSGDGFFEMNTGIINGSEAAAAYHNATHNLQLFMFNTWIDIVNGQISRPNVLCMRVNATTVSSVAANPEYTIWGFGIVIFTILSLVF
ncbi:uncharacterized protein CTRU02_205792 [Colletotrichum truncatum]|uniref:Uncharacterized protein n=1 Tax=Colletotrichum truncatum TaxID=5467 RepID=A0ACC3Z502_COLTU|nr:uncharacterized protein CTRU02_15605 [Colletotrichum truncatum]KAF6780853.1 hypothetical protein CTRU02_15605 [Colletotrichum truncatum]